MLKYTVSEVKSDIGSIVVFEDGYRRGIRKKQKTRRKWCKTCEIWVTSKKAWKQHEQGKKHQDLAKGKDRNKKVCKPCGVVLNTQKDLEEHQRGRKHFRKVNYVARKSAEVQKAKEPPRESILTKLHKKRVAELNSL